MDQVLLKWPPKVSKQTFVGSMWAGVIFTIALLLFRIYVRVKTFRKLYYDDLLVVIAWLMFLSSAIIWQLNKNDLYRSLAVSTGHSYPPPIDYPQKTEKYLRASLVVLLFFYSSLWSIKISFLIFFRRLGQKVKGQRHLWWFALAITLFSYFVCIANCGKRNRIMRQRRTLLSNMLMDVLSDIFIILIPVSILWNVQIGLRQKLALCGVFFLTFFTIIFAIIRVVTVSSASYLLDPTWLYMWSAIEQTVAITVACLGSYRALFINHDGPKRGRDSEYGSNTLLTRLGWQNAIGKESTNHSHTIVQSDGDSGGRQESMAPNRVYVKSDIRTWYSDSQAESNPKK